MEDNLYCPRLNHSHAILDFLLQVYKQFLFYLCVHQNMPSKAFTGMACRGLGWYRRNMYQWYFIKWKYPLLKLYEFSVVSKKMTAEVSDRIIGSSGGGVVVKLSKESWVWTHGQVSPLQFQRLLPPSCDLTEKMLKRSKMLEMIQPANWLATSQSYSISYVSSNFENDCIFLKASLTQKRVRRRVLYVSWRRKQGTAEL